MKIGAFFKRIFGAIRSGIQIIVHKIQDGLYAFNQWKWVKKTKDAIVWLPNRLTRNMRYRQRQAAWGVVFIIPLMVGFVYFFFVPFITTIVYSFSYVQTLSTNTVTGEFVGITTEWIGMDNYLYVWNQHATFKQLLTTSFQTTFVNVWLILIFSLIVAVVLNSKFKGRAFVRAVFFMPVIFNSQAVDIAMRTSQTLANTMEESTMELFANMFNFSDFLIDANLPMGAVNFLSGATNSIYDIISFSGVQILIFLSGIQSVPKHLYEAAKIEGATQYEIFWKITFPMVSPLMLTAGVYTIVDSLLRSQVIRTINVFSTNNFIRYFAGLGSVSYYGVHAAMSWLFAMMSIIIIAIVLIVISRMVFYYDE